MRLTKQEQQHIITAITPYLNQPAELRLFGSRTDESLKGGDIDLLLIVTEKEKQQLFGKKIDILFDIKTLIGEQKIDLVITTKQSLLTDEFLRVIHPSSALIHQF